MTYEEAQRAGEEEARSEFAIARMPDGGYDFFPAGHPVGRFENGRFERCGEIIARFWRDPQRGWKRHLDAAQDDRRKAARAAQQAALLAEFAAESEREREAGQAAAVYVHLLPQGTEADPDEDGQESPEQYLIRTSEGRWSPGEPVYVHEVADYRGLGCGMSWWETADIGCRRFPDAAAALAYVRDQLQEARQRGLEVDVDPGETGFYAHNPAPPAGE